MSFRTQFTGTKWPSYFCCHIGHVMTVGFLILRPIISGQQEPTPKSATYRINKAYSSVSFSVYKWVVMKEEGVFRDFAGQVVYDPNRPDLSRIEVTVQAASLDTGNATRDAVLRSNDFFDVAKHPTLHFVSEKVIPKGGPDIKVSGALTIHGVTKTVTVPAKMNGTRTVPGVGTLAGFEATFPLNRTEYGVNGFRWSGGNPVIGKEVTIHIALGCVRD